VYTFVWTFVTRDGLCFVWDSDKAKANITKHSVTIETGIDVYTDPFAVFEDASVPEEKREAAIGIAPLRRLLYVVFVEREDTCIRLISVRAATAREVRVYEESAGTD
jgi:uncharacterized DUF497 family protein